MYFSVVYLDDDTIHLKPGETQEECLYYLEQVVTISQFSSRVKATTVIKRDMDNFKDGLIFGCPNSLNMMSEKNIKKLRR